MHEDEFGGGRGFRLDADVEEADSVFELPAYVDGLAAHGGQGFVVGGRVVRAGDGESAERGGVLQVGHPAVELGTAVDGEESVEREIYA